MDDDHQWHLRILREWADEDLLFAAVDWSSVYAFLVLCAQRALRNAPPDCVIGGVGLTPRDFAWNAIDLMLEKKLQWKEELEVTTGRVCALLRTVMLHDIVDAIQHGEKQIVPDRETPIEVPAPDRSPDDQLMLREGDGTIARVIDDLRVHPDRQQKLFVRYLRLKLQQPGVPPRRAAKILGVTIRDIKEMNRRLKRRVRRLLPAEQIENWMRSRDRAGRES